MRRSWFDGAAGTHDKDPRHPERSAPFAGSVERRESYRRAMEDGHIDAAEVAAQKARIITLLRELEPKLDDTQHELVTSLLEEWAVLQSMHGTLMVEEFATGSGMDSFQAAVPPDEAPDETPD